MVGSVSAYNQVQRNSDTILNGTATDVGSTPHVFYTVPAGKKAIIKWLAFQMVSLGANTFMEVKIKSAPITPQQQFVDTVLQVPNINPNFELAAGDTITADGDNVANNGTINMFLTVSELPA